MCSFRRANITAYTSIAYPCSQNSLATDLFFSLFVVGPRHYLICQQRFIMNGCCRLLAAHEMVAIRLSPLCMMSSIIMRRRVMSCSRPPIMKKIFFQSKTLECTTFCSVVQWAPCCRTTTTNHCTLNNDEAILEAKPFWIWMPERGLASDLNGIVVAHGP